MPKIIQKRIVKITNFLVSTVARNSGNCNLIGCVGCYEYTCICNLIQPSKCFVSPQTHNLNLSIA